MRAGVLVPIKDFRLAKGRLAERLGPAARADLARHLAGVVLAAARPLPVWVVCDDDDVARWAHGRGAHTLLRPGLGLNGSVASGVEHLRGEGIDRVIVAHSDLPRAEQLAWVADFDGVTVVPDRHEDGTNVMAVPTAVAFEFGYGPRSFARHVAETERLGLPLRIARDERLGWDVDVPDDLATVEAWTSPDNPRPPTTP